MVNKSKNNKETLSYQIRIAGQLGEGWKNWFGEVEVRPTANGNTLLIFPALDQAALYGQLKKTRDLGLELISVQRLTVKDQ